MESLPRLSNHHRATRQFLLAVPIMTAGFLLWSNTDYLGDHSFRWTPLKSQPLKATRSQLNHQQVWDKLVARPDILSAFLICSCGCGERVDFSKGQFEVKNGHAFVQAHFKCHTCGKPLHSAASSPPSREDFPTGHEEEGWVFLRDGKLYCVHHFIDECCHSCEACGVPLGDQIVVDPRAGCGFCVNCFHQEEADHAKHFKTASVESQSQAAELLGKVKSWMKQEMGLDFDGNEGDIPLAVQKLEELLRLHGSTKGMNDMQVHTLGLTVKEASRPSLFSKKVYTPKQVLLEKGTSKELAGAVLAHELMHCWIALYLTPSSELPEEVEEGLCELISYLWLARWHKESSLRARLEEGGGKEDATYLLGRMENNWETAQGRGFHRAFASLQGQEEGNLRLLLAHIQHHHNFPIH